MIDIDRVLHASPFGIPRKKKCLTEFFTFAEKNNLNPISTDEVFKNQEYLKSQYNWPKVKILEIKLKSLNFIFSAPLGPKRKISVPI